MIIVAFMLQAVSPAPATAPAPVQIPVQPTVQQQFDLASAATVEGRCDDAVAGFDALERRVSATRSPLVLATIRARKGICLESLVRDADARSALEYALATLSPTDEVSAADRFNARMALGRVYYRTFDFALARDAFAAALASASADARVDPLIWLARASSFENQEQGLAHADEALAMAQAGGRDNRRNIAAARTARARILLNRGDHAGAFSELRRAVSEQGGLDTSVTASELITRADVAVAATLSGNREEAQRYIAYTGAGRLEQGPFAGAVDMQPPACGPETGLEPQDRAIVEFGISTSGAVSYASPIYVSRGGDRAAATFAEAVTHWSWLPEDVAKIGPLFRALTRIELRCSTATRPLDAAAFAGTAIDEWLAAQGIPTFAAQAPEVEALRLAKAQEQRLLAAGGGPGLIPVWRAIGSSRAASAEQISDAYARAMAAARSAGAPTIVELALEIEKTSRISIVDEERGRVFRDIAARADAAAEPVSASIARLYAVEPMFLRRPPADAASLLQVVAADDRLPVGHPLRVTALVRLANLQAAAGNIDAARASYAATGLDAQQCSLVDARPSMRRSGVSSGDFPMEAQRWGFEGWARVEFDIQPDGRTASQRAVISYPPFVFNDAAVGIMRDARYTQTYRPEGDPGCGGATQNVRFQLPYN